MLLFSRRVAVALAGMALVALALPGGAGASTPTGAPTGARTGLAGEASYIVQFAPGVVAKREATVLAMQGIAVDRVYEHVLNGAAVRMNATAAAALTHNPNVALVEPDGVVTTVGTQTSPTWGLDRVDQRSLPLSGSYTWDSAGAGVSAYIIDTGVRSDHSEFTGRVSPGTTVVNDGRGTSDCNGHGTHVAGTVAGTTYGVAKAATVVPVRVLDCNGSGSWSGVIAGLDWVVANHVAGAPAVANMSLGGGASSSVDAAVAAVVADGVSVAVAAGNSNADACTTSPARTPSALTVAASTSVDARASFSNFGSCVDVFAPGVNITSAWSTTASATNTISGTSMASPHVAGIAAVTLGATPTLTPAQVHDQLVANATPGIVASAGTNTPNRLVYVGSEPQPALATAPAAPTAVGVANVARTSATITWTPGSNGGSAFTGHTVTVYQNAKRIGSITTSGTTTAITITGLRAATTYTFGVRSTNAVGTSPERVSAPVTTLR